MINRTHVFVILAFFILSGCQTTGGTIGNLLPAPKLLKGKIENSIYYARDNVFSVSVPHKEGTNYYLYMEIKEQYSDPSTYVSFGPAEFDTAVYRIEVLKREKNPGMPPDLKSVTNVVLDHYKKGLVQGYGAAIAELKTRKEQINGKPALYWQLEQIVPKGKYYSNTPETLTHEVYAIDYGSNIAIVWVQIPNTRRAGAAISPISFAESIKVY